MVNAKSPPRTEVDSIYNHCKLLYLWISMTGFCDGRNIRKVLYF